jgi:hypothetical protein
MTFSVDSYLGATFDVHNYSCWHFACDVWFDLTKVRLHSGIEDWRVSALHEYAGCYAVHSLQKLDAIVDPCLVLMQRKNINPHVGVYVNGRVLQLGPSGASHVSLHSATACFPTVTFYRNATPT